MDYHVPSLTKQFLAILTLYFCTTPYVHMYGVVKKWLLRNGDFFFLWTHGRFPRERGMEYDENELSLESTKNQSDQHRKQGEPFKQEEKRGQSENAGQFLFF